MHITSDNFRDEPTRYSILDLTRVELATLRLALIEHAGKPLPDLAAKIRDFLDREVGKGPAKPNQLADFTVFGFNTERAYQRDGQRISVGYKLDTSYEAEVLVLFKDHSRGIEGRIKAEQIRAAKHIFLQRNNYTRAKMVMAAYDAGHYEYHPQANWLDAGEWPVISL